MREILEHVDARTKRAVYVIVQKALRDGRLVRPKQCSWCGHEHRRIEGHHPDYARPLMVVWICRPCHRKHHEPYRAGRWIFSPRVQRYQQRQDSRRPSHS